AGRSAASGLKPDCAEQRESRGRHRTPGEAGRTRFRPVAGRPDILQLPPHRRRHAGQDRPPGTAGERGRHGRHGLRAGDNAQPFASLKTNVGVSVPLVPGCREPTRGRTPTPSGGAKAPLVPLFIKVARVLLSEGPTLSLPKTER